MKRMRWQRRRCTAGIRFHLLPVLFCSAAEFEAEQAYIKTLSLLRSVETLGRGRRAGCPCPQCRACNVPSTPGCVDAEPRVPRLLSVAFRGAGARLRC